MVGKGIADPILDHIRLLLEDGETSGGMVGVVAYLYL